jgi:hypothetical protein
MDYHRRAGGHTLSSMRLIVVHAQKVIAVRPDNRLLDLRLTAMGVWMGSPARRAELAGQHALLDHLIRSL